jgi:hypothetical protein
MQENFEMRQEGGAESAAQGKEWRVPFVIRGAVTVRAETPKQASEAAIWLSTEEMAAAAREIHLQEAEEAGL